MFERFVSRAVERGELTAASRSLRVINPAVRSIPLRAIHDTSPGSGEVIGEIVDVIWLPLLDAY